MSRPRPWPVKVEPGSRMVTFSEDGTTVLENTFSIKEGSKADIVAHLPASHQAILWSRCTSTTQSRCPRQGATGRFHVAAVPPADIVVNDQVLFANIEMASRSSWWWSPHTRSIVPSKEKEPVFFGPVNLTVKGGAINRVYAVVTRRRR